MRKLIVFLHGYGADELNFGGVVDFFRYRLKSQSEFSYLNLAGLDPCELDILGKGRQWFSFAGVITENGLDETQYPTLKDRVEQANKRIMAKLYETRYLYDQVYLLGFSQGAMMALDLALFGGPFAKVVSFAGCILRPEQPLFKPQVCLIHGIHDRVVDYNSSKVTREFLQQKQIDFVVHDTNDAHNISNESLEIGCEFLTR